MLKYRGEVMPLRCRDNPVEWDAINVFRERMMAKFYPDWFLFDLNKIGLINPGDIMLLKVLGLGSDHLYHMKRLGYDKVFVEDIRVAEKVLDENNPISIELYRRRW